ncbi:hypothetical protein Tco_1094994 [Tanacetum coccineum]
MIFQNYLKESWCTAVVVKPTPPNGNSEPIPLMESGIRFIVQNKGLRNDKGEALATFVNRTPMLKTWFPMMMVFSLLKETKIDIGEIIYIDLITRLTETPRKKYVAYPRFILCVLERLMNIDYTQDTPLRSTPLILMSTTPLLKKLGKKKKSQTMTKPKTKSQGPEDSIIPPKSPSPDKAQPESSKSKEGKKHKKSKESLKPSDSESSSASLSSKPYDNYMPITEMVLAKTLQGFSEILYAQVAEDNWKKHKEAIASYADLKMEIAGFHDATF